VSAAGPLLEELRARSVLLPGRSIEDDRRAEAAEFFALAEPAEAGPSDYVTDLTRLDDAALFAYLESSATAGLTRNLLKSVRLGQAAELLAALGERYPEGDRARVRVLDYGCGTSDHGLAFALEGYNVTIADIPSKVRFAAWRYARRGLPVEVIEIDNTNWKHPRVGHRDAILCGEVLEHLRYPLSTVRALLDALPVGGLLWVSAYPFREKRRGGTHLEEAFRERPMVKRELKRRCDRIRREDLQGYLLEKRRPGLLERIFSHFRES